jgi:hypothetical protein
VTRFPRTHALAALAVALCGGCATERPDPAEAVARDAGAAEDFAPQLPLFALEDPYDNRHERDQLLEHGGLLVVVTAPTVDHGRAQEAWNAALSATAPANARWVFLEDLSQSDLKRTASNRMAEEFDPDRAPLLLVDTDGAVRRGMEVDAGETVVLVYDQAGNLVFAETGEASPERARRAWASLGRPQG